MLHHNAVEIGSEPDIVSAVLARREEVRRVRAVGHRGSKNDCFLTAGTPLRFDHYDKVLAVGDGRVLAQAGVTVGRLNDVLAAHGLAVPTPGEWAGCTLGGAVATGTHGGSNSHGILSSSILAMRLITADGSALELDRNSEHFNHAAVSLGMLGVTSTLSLECVPHFCLALETRILPFDQYVRTHETANRENEFYSAVWLPAARRVVTFAANPAPPPRTPGHRRTRFGPYTFLLDAVSRRVPLPEQLYACLTGTTVSEAGPILSPISYGPRRLQLLRWLCGSWKAVEYAVPLARATESLLLLERFAADHRGTLTHPVGLRATARDDFSLSPCYGRDTFWLDVFFRDDPCLEGELAELFMGLGARCHWGKHIGLSPDYLRGRYERWGAFAEARAQLDPEHVFANHYTECLAL
jgi:FAD/FMN-containing dehydrogenase